MARELKYSTRHTDFEALQREMRELSGQSDDADDGHNDEDEYSDRYR